MAKVRKIRGGFELKTSWGPARMLIHLESGEDGQAARDLQAAHQLQIDERGSYVSSSTIPEGIASEWRPLRWLIRVINHRISARSNQIASSLGRYPDDPVLPPNAWMLEPIEAPRNG